MQEFLEFLLDLLTLKSRKRGPLAVRAEVRGEHVVLALENQGKRKLEFAAVQARDANGKRCFPKTDLPARAALRPGEPQALRIAASELAAQGCRQLEVLDTTGAAWAVDGFEPARPGA